MTREEATERLKAILEEATEYENAVCYVTSDDADALEMAIKALEAPPNDNWEGYSKRLWKAAYQRGVADINVGKIQKARKIIEDAGFQHVIMHRADVLDEMFKNNLGEVADSVAEMNNVIYEVLEVLGNDT